MSNNKIAFYCSTDNNMVKLTNELYKSIMKIYDKDTFDFYITVDSTVDESDIIKGDNIFLVNIEKEIEKQNLSSLKDTVLFGRITFLTYSRLFISKVVPKKQHDTIIYLDVDGLLINELPDKYINSDKNISFYPTNTKEKFKQSYNWIVSNVKDNIINSKVADLFENEGYFQGGLIIINDIDSYAVLEEKCIDFLKAPNLKIDDQNLMNYLNDGIIEVLIDPGMNYRPDLSKYVNREEVFFLHCAGDNKPWNDNADLGNYQDYLGEIKEHYGK